jgi:hypothetical protein
VIVRLYVPDDVGMPEITAEFGSMDTPLGAPETDHVYGVIPPVAVIAWAVYVVPAVAVDGLKDNVAIERVAAWGLTVRLNPFEAVCCGFPLSRTVTVGLKVPEVKGVPESMPLVASIVRPLGASVTDQV